jgi:hypothetical protein
VGADEAIFERGPLHVTRLFSHNRRSEVLLLGCLFGLLFTISCERRVDPAPKPQPPPFEFLGTWGEKGDGPGKLDAPVAFGLDALGNVYFADSGEGFVDKFTSDGTPLLSFGDPRTRQSSGIAVDRGGAIYVADPARRSIVIFFPNGTFLRAFRVAVRQGFSGPLGISVDSDGILYVPDPAGARVLKLNSRGRPLKFSNAAPNAASAKDQPSAVATAPDGSVFVAYGETGGVRKYSSDGSLITSWSAAGQRAGDSGAITGIAATDHYVFTASPAPPRIRIWTLDGKHKLDSDLGGRIDGVAAPQIAVTPDATLLVFDPAAPRVYRFQMHF